MTVLEGASDWLTATATTTVVTLTASANTTTKTNRAVVALPVGEQILMFEVTQAPSSVTIPTLNSYKYSIGRNAGETLEILINNGAGMSLQTPIITYLRGADWLEMTTTGSSVPADGKVQFRTKTANPSVLGIGQTRTAVVSLTVGDYNFIFEITQQF